MGAVQLALPDARSRRTWGSTNAQWHTHTQHSLMVVDFSADNNTPFILFIPLSASLVVYHTKNLVVV
jgi:hypothetical protein